jgi:hypothetical protein
MPPLPEPDYTRKRFAGGRASANGDGHAPYRLTAEIVALSVACTWPEAKQEWELVSVYFADADRPGTCLCGHSPIIEHCVLVNRCNGNTAVVGNVCVTRFLGLDADAIFRSLRRLQANPAGAMSPAAVEHAHGRGWLNDWERGFYLKTLRWRRLTPKQLAKRAEINRAVLRRATGEGGRRHA